MSHWVYYYLSYGEQDSEGNPTATYKWNKNSGGNVPTTETTGLPELIYYNKTTTEINDQFKPYPIIHGGFSVVAFPVYKDSLYQIYNQKANTNAGMMKVYLQSADSFLKNNNSAYIYAIKNSIMPPWELKSRTQGTDYSIEDADAHFGVLLNLKISTYSGGISGNPYQWDYNDWGCEFIAFEHKYDQLSGVHWDVGGILVERQCFDYFPILYLDSQLYEDTYTPTQVQTTDNLEPKIYNEDYSTYHIYFGGQTYDMPVLKTSNYPSFRYYEPLTPDITKFYLSFNKSTSTSDAYGESKLETNIFDLTQNDYTGLVGSLDLSMWFSKSKLDEWLATNKNNLQIFQNNQQLQGNIAVQNATMGLLGGALGMATSIFTGNPLGAIGGLVSGAQGIKSISQTMMQMQNEAQNRDLTIDNMRQSPARMSALNSNAVLMQNVDGFGIYIELQEPIPHEKQQIIDHMKRYGYTVNKLGSVNSYLKSGLTNNLKRVQYVYIKALISALSGVPMSTEERLDFKQRFESGIRFWNGDSINYSLINYEYGTGA